MNSAVLTQDAYFGGRRLAGMDRVGSATQVGSQNVSFYPYGEDKGTPGANDNCKFGTYLRDSATGLDYAMNRYYSSGSGRFVSPDSYWRSVRPASPQSWNRYAYVSNDPANGVDPNGLCDFAAAGITNSPSNAGAFATANANSIVAYPYSSGATGSFGGLMNVLQVAHQALGPNSSTFAAVQGLLAAAAQGGPINVVTWSGGAASFTAAVKWLNANGASNIVSSINDITYVSPGNLGNLYVNSNTVVLAGNSAQDTLATSGTLVSGNVPIYRNDACTHNFGCIIGGSLASVWNSRATSPCGSAFSIFQPVPYTPSSSNWSNLFGIPGGIYSAFDAGTYWEFGEDDVMDGDALTPSVTSTFNPIIP
jgi:RHS repeat-associated protein